MKNKLTTDQTLTPDKVREMLRFISKSMNAEESGGPVAPYFVGTTRGTVLVNENGCSFVDDEGNVTGAADRQLVIDAFESNE
jgi:hypothetical protein